MKSLIFLCDYGRCDRRFAFPSGVCRSSERERSTRSVLSLASMLPARAPNSVRVLSHSASMLFAAITGYDLDASNVYHGFLRKTNGSILVFDAPWRRPRCG